MEIFDVHNERRGDEVHFPGRRLTLELSQAEVARGGSDSV